MLLICALWCATGEIADATVVAFEFAGKVTKAAGGPLGVSVALNDPVTGKFTYDTAAPKTLDVTFPTLCVDCAYRQQRVNGFRATVGSVEFRADDYAIEHFDNLNGTTDIFSIGYMNYYSPALAPISVAGVPQTAGRFQISLVGLTTALSGASLPANLNLANFTLIKRGVISKVFPGQSNIEFSITSLTAAQVDPLPTTAPEPSTGMLLGMAVVFMSLANNNFRSTASRKRQRLQSSRPG
jgi:hypothetical protein